MTSTHVGPGRVNLRRVELTDLRCFTAAALEPDPVGTTVLVGPNGIGKTTFLEAVAFLGTLRSFRTSDREVMVRKGSERAIVRGELDRNGSPVLVEAEVPARGRLRVQLNRNAVRDRTELTEAVPVTVFTPDDLALVRGGPAYRRQLLDDALRLLDRATAHALDGLDRVLRQRAALLRQADRRRTADMVASLDVWDARLASVGTAVAVARDELADALAPRVARAYRSLAGTAGTDPAEISIGLCYRRSWSGDLADALAGARSDDLRRGVTTTGPHRDDLSLQLAGREARTQASQGEQRSLALALRLAVHQLVTERGSGPPILLLDDVFSELDPLRSRALMRQLPAGQTLVTSAAPLPPGVEASTVVDIAGLGRR